METEEQIENINYGLGKKIYLGMKRIFDFLASFILLILLSPVFIIIMILIKKDSKGPCFFIHKRIGKNGQLLGVFKFRTMVDNAEELLNNLTDEQEKEFRENFKMEDDFRVTKIGKFLRKSSLDELPQLLNILLGDMSFVGPRPVIKDELRKYGKYKDKFLSVTPGLTGYWQANGRSNTTYEERVAMDMYYIDHMGILLDIKILFQTVGAVIRKDGAV